MSDADRNKGIGLIASAMAGQTPPTTFGTPGPDSFPYSGIFGIGSYAARPEVNGLYFNGQTITLDGYKFIRCRFDNCKLQVHSVNFELINCVVDPSTIISYGPSVLKVIELFNSRYPWAYEHLPGFVPIRNADGTITITERTK